MKSPGSEYRNQQLSISIFNDKLEKILSNNDFFNYTKEILYAKTSLKDKYEKEFIPITKQKVIHKSNSQSSFHVKASDKSEVKIINRKNLIDFIMDSTTTNFPKFHQYTFMKDIKDKESELFSMIKTKLIKPLKKNSSMGNLSLSNFKNMPNKNSNINSLSDTLSNKNEWESMLAKTSAFDFTSKNGVNQKQELINIGEMNNINKIQNMTHSIPKSYSQTQKNFSSINEFNNFSERFLKNKEIKKNLALKNKGISTFAFVNSNTGFDSRYNSNMSTSNNNASKEKKVILPNVTKYKDSTTNNNIEEAKIKGNHFKINDLFRQSCFGKNFISQDFHKTTRVKPTNSTNNNANINVHYNKHKSQTFLLNNLSKKLGLSSEPKIIITDPLGRNPASTFKTLSSNFEKSNFMNFHSNENNEEYLKKKDNFQRSIEIFSNDNLVNFLRLPSRKEPDPPKSESQLAYREINIKLFNEARKTIKLFLKNRYDGLVENRIGGNFIYVYKYLQSVEDFPIHLLHKNFLFYSYLSTIMHDELEELRLDINFLYSMNFYVFLRKLLEHLKNLRKKSTYCNMQKFIEEVNCVTKSTSKEINETCIHEFLYKYFCFFGRVDLVHIYANVIMQSFAIEDEAVRHEQYFNNNKQMYLMINLKFGLVNKIGYLKKLLSLLLPSNRFFIEEVLNFQKYFEVDKLTLLSITKVEVLNIEKLKGERVLKINKFFNNVVKYILEESQM